jgi:flagellar biosynthetic protein FliO
MLCLGAWVFGQSGEADAGGLSAGQEAAGESQAAAEAEGGASDAGAQDAERRESDMAGGGNVDETTLTFGEEEDGAPAAGDDAPGSINSFGIWDFVRMVIVLGIVIVIIYVVFYLLKRASGGRLENSPLIRVLGSHALPGNKALHLVEVGRQVFLIGVADNSISFISEISDQESLDELRLAASGSQGERRGSFADMLSGFFHGGGAGSSYAGGPNSVESSDRTGESGRSTGPGQRGPAAGSSGGNGATPASFFEAQKERLRKLR